MGDTVLALNKMKQLAEGGDLVCEGLTLQAEAGRVVRMRGLGVEQRERMADAILGKAPPAEGEVRFEGVAWTDRSWRAQCDARYRIGRVHVEPRFLSNLDLDENVLLPLLHHGTVGADTATRQAEAVANRLGVAPLPRKRASRVPRRTLCAAEWVRALAPAPALLLVEHPFEPWGDPMRAILRELLVEFRDRGGAAVWLDRDAPAGAALLPCDIDIDMQSLRAAPRGG